jgi:hypothetical protein
LKNLIKNIEGRSTSSEEAPEYFGTKGSLSLKNENIMCDIYNTGQSVLAGNNVVPLQPMDEKQISAQFWHKQEDESN